MTNKEGKEIKRKKDDSQGNGKKNLALGCVER